MGIRLNQMTVGDTWQFTVAAADYPATEWTMKLYLVPRFTTPVQAPFDLTAAAYSLDGTVHEFTVAAAVTATYKAGTYGYYTVVTKGSERYTLDASEWSGEVVLLADPTALTQGHDGRSDTRKALEDAQAAYRTFMATNGMVSEYEINGRRVRYNSSLQILEHIESLKTDVNREQKAEAIRRGLADPRKIYVRAYR